MLQGSILLVTYAFYAYKIIKINLSTIIPQEAPTSANNYVLKLLHFSDKIVTVHYGRKIYAIRITGDLRSGHTLLKVIPLSSNRHLFVRNTVSWLYYGTCSRSGSNGHREWVIKGTSLIGDHETSTSRAQLQLEGFFGTDIDSTVAFEIFDDYFYAVSNQASFNLGEIN